MPALPFPGTLEAAHNLYAEPACRGRHGQVEGPPPRPTRRGFSLYFFIRILSASLFGDLYRQDLPTFGHGNAKLPSSTLTFSIPAGFTCPGAHLCLSRAIHKEGQPIRIQDGPDTVFRCSAANDELRPSVSESRWRNYRLIEAAIKAGTLPLLLEAALTLSARSFSSHVRWFISGDCYHPALRDAILHTAQATPGLIHYAYTKNLPLWLDQHKLLPVPENFRLTASWGGRFDSLLQQGLFPRTARVVNTEEEAVALGLAIDYDDRHAWDATPSHFAHLVHGMQPKGSASGAAIRARRKAGLFSGYGRSSRSHRLVAR